MKHLLCFQAGHSPWHSPLEYGQGEDFLPVLRNRYDVVPGGKGFSNENIVDTDQVRARWSNQHRCHNRYNGRVGLSGNSLYYLHCDRVSIGFCCELQAQWHLYLSVYTAIPSGFSTVCWHKWQSADICGDFSNFPHRVACDAGVAGCGSGNGRLYAHGLFS